MKNKFIQESIFKAWYGYNGESPPYYFSVGGCLPSPAHLSISVTWEEGKEIKNAEKEGLK